jgi:hypothetical protein
VGNPDKNNPNLDRGHGLKNNDLAQLTGNSTSRFRFQQFIAVSAFRLSVQSQAEAEKYP